MKFNTGFFCDSDVKKHDCTTAHLIVRPELSFTIKEIAQRFTLQNIIAEGQRSNPIYNGDSTDVDFDQPSVNVPPMYDLVDARDDTMRVLQARQAVFEAMRNKQNVKDLNKSDDKTAANDPGFAGSAGSPD